MRGAFAACALLLFVGVAVADVYMHNPRGSNDRLDTAGTNRQNANRLFDSQNNDKGGYNHGYMYYYGGSVLPVEWTNQHGLGPNANLYSEIIIQYMCDDTSPDMRDGTSENTIAAPGTDFTRGMHEPYAWYAACSVRERNKGLYTADQNMNNRDTAKYTRQDNQGTRYGFECPEERDYYPYWHPTLWKDLAVLTSRPERCSFYKRNSNNNNAKGYCDLTKETLKKLQQAGNTSATFNAWLLSQEYNNPTSCVGAGYQWLEQKHGIAPPVCIEAPLSRDNHNGNVVQEMADGRTRGGFPAYWNWTLPDVSKPTKCVLRMRYNISTGDFDPDLTDSTANNKGQPLGVTNNPTIRWANATDDGIDVDLTLAIDTSQFGRTFQDRSHLFEIVPRIYGGGKVYNLNVRGKRGNIVQVYPAVEYDFVPNELKLKTRDRIHLQWTGSNTNPNGNDGQGQAQTDRSNFVQMINGTTNYPAFFSKFRFYQSNPGGQFDRFKPLLNPNSSDLYAIRRLALNMAQVPSGIALVSNSNNQRELNDAAPYYDFGLLKVSKGRYEYMCTRNNNFSNRSQKGQIQAVSNNDSNVTAAIVIGCIVFGVIMLGCVIVMWGVYGTARPDSLIGGTWVSTKEFFMGFVNH